MVIKLFGLVQSYYKNVVANKGKN